MTHRQCYYFIAVLIFSKFCCLSGLTLPTLIEQRCKRRTFVLGSITTIFFLPTVSLAAEAAKKKKCTDIESCREIGDKKVEQDLKDNPVTRLDNGLRYKKLKDGYGEKKIDESSLVVDLIYSISSASGGYMYSQGFGFEKIDIGNGLQSDAGLDSYRAALGKGNLPVGIESALLGMRKGERRRIEVPPAIGFETSAWKPEPRSMRGKKQIEIYKVLLNGRGTSQPAFPAPLIWDVEVLSFRGSK